VFFLFADQNLLAPNLSSIANDFGFDDRKRDKLLGGNIAFGFFIVGGSFALVIGYFTDIMNRCLLFGIVVAIGESACLATYWVRNYEQLFLCRVLTGISFGGATPIIFSILGDHYSGSSRIYVSTLVGIASSAGVSVGQFLSGMIGPILGWRAPFLIISAPAILLAMLVFFTVDEPKRGHQEEAMKKLRSANNNVSNREQETILRYHSGDAVAPAVSSIVTSLEEGIRLHPEFAFAKPVTVNCVDSHKDTSSAVYRNSSLTTPAYPQFESGSSEQRLRTPLAMNDSASTQLDSQNPHVHVSNGTVDTGRPTEETANAESKHQSSATIVNNPMLSIQVVDYSEHENEEPISPVVDKAELEYSEKIEWRKVVQLFRTPSVLIIFMQGFPGCLPWGMIYIFLNDYLSSDRGLSVQAATAALTVFGIGGLLGQLFGGWVGQRVYNRSPVYQCYLMGGSTLLSVPPALYILNTKTVGDLGFYFMCICFGFIVNMNGPNVRAVLQNVCMPEIRGTAFSIFTLTDDIGKGLGPALVVFMIEDFHGNRRLAFSAVVYFWLFCGCMLLVLSLTVVRDERRVQRRVAVAVTGTLDPGSSHSVHNPQYGLFRSRDSDSFPSQGNYAVPNSISGSYSSGGYSSAGSDRSNYDPAKRNVNNSGRHGGIPYHVVDTSHSSMLNQIHINVTGLLRLETSSTAANPSIASPSSFYVPLSSHSAGEDEAAGNNIRRIDLDEEQ
jgi:MFS family permease